MGCISYYNKATDIPEDHLIYVGNFDVAGVFYRMENARDFLETGSNLLKLMPEPANPHDPNAIKVCGRYKGFMGAKLIHVGYIPRDLAAIIVSGDFQNDLSAKLVSTNDYEDSIAITIQLFGPKDRYKAFSDLLESAFHDD